MNGHYTSKHAQNDSSLVLDKKIKTADVAPASPHSNTLQPLVWRACLDDAVFCSHLQHCSADKSNPTDNNDSPNMQTKLSVMTKTLSNLVHTLSMWMHGLHLQNGQNSTETNYTPVFTWMCTGANTNFFQNRIPDQVCRCVRQPASNSEWYTHTKKDKQKKTHFIFMECYM